MTSHIPWHTIDTIVFDCGDTLAHIEPLRDQLIHEVLAELGFNFPHERISHAFTCADFVMKQQSSREKTQDDKKNFFNRFNVTLAHALGIESKAELFNSKLQEHIRAHRKWVPKPGATALLSEIQDHFPLYILANWAACLPDLLEEMEIGQYFRGIYASEALGAEKPSPEIFERFVEYAGIDPERALYVGNEYRADVIGSRQHGFLPVLIHPAWANNGGADCLVFESLEALHRDFSRSKTEL